MKPVPSYPRTGHWRWSEKLHRDDTYHSDPERFLRRPVIITEKLDGGNTCLARGEVYARSTTLPTHDGWFAMVRKHHAWKTVGLSPDLYTYGEDLYGIHSIEYNPLREDQTYYVFGVRNADYWYSWDEVTEHARELGMPTVPVVYDSRIQGEFQTTDEITAFFKAKRKEPSALGIEAEGFVIRVLEGFNDAEFRLNVAKFVRAGHVQTDEHWTKNWQPARLLK